LKRFILKSEPEPRDKKGVIRLTGSDYHYLAHVRRLAEGECFPALLPRGGEVLVRVLSINNGILTGECSAAAEDKEGAASSPSIILFQALPKGDKMDLIVRQAAETGLVQVVPFVSEFSVVKAGAGGQKATRWERIIREARQQSGSRIETGICAPLTFDKLFEYWDEIKSAVQNPLGFLFHHLPLANESIHSYLEKVPQTIALVIGPEGGFSGAEVNRFIEAGFKPITIGDTIMRTETAALYCAAAIRIILLERDSWDLKHLKTGSV
jgi:16S rRNA (uracil1498-N3)-methyltransferase